MIKYTPKSNLPSQRWIFAGCLAAIGLALASSVAVAQTVTLSGETKRWHNVILTVDGPFASETGSPNPFMDYRMDVTFTHSSGTPSYVVPGYFAADGDAANTSADSGNKWRAHLSPDKIGTWSYSIDFRTGTDVAVSDNPGSFATVSPHGVTGTFNVTETDKGGIDNRAYGRLEYVGEHFLKYAGSGEYFIKQGTDSPENFLSYADFDNATNVLQRKTWQPHQQDFDAAAADPNDPVDITAFTWDNGRGSEILGAVKYLATEGLNAFSFITFSLDGDTKDVYPHLITGSVSDFENNFDHSTEGALGEKGLAWEQGAVFKDRFDVSKLAQWEQVFSYGDTQGMFLHFKMNETENDRKMDGGVLGRERKAYYRQLVARFGHHLALNWNFGEELDLHKENELNDSNQLNLKAFTAYMADIDPYDHHRVVHTFPFQKNAVYGPTVGDPANGGSELTGASLQTSRGDFSELHGDALTWRANSAAAGRKWVIAVDEPGSANSGLRPDGDRPDGDSVNQTNARKNALWGTMMAGAMGNEWYFGAGLEGDLLNEDFRERDDYWDICRIALNFFRDGIPFWEMTPDDDLVAGDNDYVFFKDGELYLVYYKDASAANDLDLTGVGGIYSVSWFDPRNGGALQSGSVTSVTGGGLVDLGNPPSASTADWLAVVEIIGGGATNSYFEAESGSLSPNFAPFEVLTDADASAGEFIAVQPGNNSIGSAPASGIAEYSFTLEQADTVEIYFRTIAPSGTDDSFWVDVDGSGFIRFNVPNSSDWQWNPVTDGAVGNAIVTYQLGAGQHTLNVAYREDGTLLDRIFVSADGSLPVDDPAPPPPPPGGDYEASVSIDPWSSNWGFTLEIANNSSSANLASMKLLVSGGGEFDKFEPNSVFTVTPDIGGGGGDRAAEVTLDFSGSGLAAGSSVTTGADNSFNNDIDGTVTGIEVEFTFSDGTILTGSLDDVGDSDDGDARFYTVTLSGDGDGGDPAGPIFEAEAFDASSLPGPWQEFSDDPNASGSYMSVPNTANITSLNAAPNPGYLDYQFELDSAGPVFVWIRVRAPTFFDDSVWIDVVEDSGSPYKWNGFAGSTVGDEWVWLEWTNQKPSSLPAGTNTLRVYYREDGLGFDQFAISTDPSFDPNSN